MDGVRLAASKVALLVGLHEYGDVSEAILDYVYQGHEELLESDAKTLQLRIVSQDEEIRSLVAKTGKKLAPQLKEILLWTEQRKETTSLETAQELLKGVDGLVATAQKKQKLVAEEAAEIKRLISERIRLSYGARNEDVALQTYEKSTGCTVRLTNELFYFLLFPNVDDSSTELDFSALERQIRTRVVSKGQILRSNEEESEGDAENSEGGAYFSICGMVDGVTDTLEIMEDDDWQLVPIVIEVKNRMRAFRVPPPLYDHIQMAVYMKMVDVRAGDLVQCLNNDRTSIHISRVSLDAYPLSSSSMASAGLWVSVLLPRLYTVAQTIYKFRRNDRLRLAYLNGSESERMEMLRRECDFL
ncbi:hypothetical protein Poli38472_008450 [Pythium oligandrum]|uniref:Uncharacterized protein n=1 Tax=Pythium oligandrum TaxID=41045 RepID=A0A8K1FDP3_PYTOL|nr:hypothetical protein Poli38472_008450 [Pythium oligandrum]|eukprot:TMW55802.1 hypothetical protein Poli38472_008450 [Pythium oligandrum]